MATQELKTHFKKTILRKKFKYIMHLLVPVIEFSLVIACIFFFNRCTPLAPSITDKSAKKQDNTSIGKQEAPLKRDVIAPALPPAKSTAKTTEFEEFKIDRVLLTSTDDIEAIMREPEAAKKALPLPAKNGTAGAPAANLNLSLIDILARTPKIFRISVADHKVKDLLEKNAKLDIDLREGLIELGLNDQQTDVQITNFLKAWDQEKVHLALLISRDKQKVESVLFRKRQVKLFVAKKQNNATIRIKIRYENDRFSRRLNQKIEEADQVSILAVQKP